MPIGKALDSPEMKRAPISLLNSGALSYLYRANFKDMPKLIDLTGKTFGRLTVISYSHTKNRSAVWNCICSCGGISKAYSHNLKSGHAKSCGCGKIESRRTHGETGKTKEYSAWNKMLGRCLNRNNKNYIEYGERGITVCDRWRNSYSNFLLDVGRAPSPEHSLDRKDNNGNYEPGNCRWATRKEQGNNKRNNRLISLAGETKTLAEWVSLTGIARGAIEMRIKRGWSIERVLNYKL